MKGSQYRRGEKPTRAGPSPVRKLLATLRRATGRGERTRFALRRGNSRWSARSEPLRSRPVAGSWRSRPNSAASAGTPGPWPGVFSARWTRISSSGAARVYRGRGARERPDVTTGTLKPSERAVLVEVTGWYKQCENRSRMRRWAGADDLSFGGLSISHLRHPQWVSSDSGGQGRLGGDRGE